MNTGKAGMLNKKREIFIKKKNGYLIPVIAYLCVNNHNLSNLILIIEPDTMLSLFEEETND